jgi:hypothetical protein
VLIPALVRVGEALAVGWVVRFALDLGEVGVFRLQHSAGVGVSTVTVTAITRASGVLVMDVCSSVAAGPEATSFGRYPRRSWELRAAHVRRSGDPRERAALIEEFMPLARSLARGFGTNRDSRDDLVQVACLGLVKAF